MFQSIARLFGRPKKVFTEYAFKQVDFALRDDGVVQYAQWLHPGEFGNEVRQEHVDFFRRYVKRGDFAIDIGANEGDTTVPMALAAGREGLTLALEPNPHVFRVLEANAALNTDKTRIVPLNFAATADDGEFTFGSGDPSYGNGGIVGFTHNKPRNTRYTFRVTGRHLPRYLAAHHADALSKLTFIKIDTEGYDKEIVKSMSDLIATYRPTLVVECFGSSLPAEKLELYDVIARHGYTLAWLDDFVLSKHVPMERHAVVVKQTRNILALPSETVR
ncbi:MAG: FkbM family methyltransferase [Gemmatimonadaceae bacterium]|nr:FkbM family methyltransferase [Gemmatimonadaceae bacterium]